MSVVGGSSLAGCSRLESGASGAEDRPRRTTYDVPDLTRTTTAGTTTADPGREVQFGAVSFPPTGRPAYRRWLPSPDALPDMDLGNSPAYRALVVDHQRIRDLAESVPDAYDTHRRLARHRLDYFGVGFERYRRVVQLGYRAVVIEADVDRSVVGTTLRETGYRPTGEHRGYRVFDRDDSPRAVAVGDEALVFAALTGEPDPAGIVRTILDAEAGSTRRYHEERGSSRLLTDATGRPPVALLSDRPGARRVPGTEFAIARGPPLGQQFAGLVGFATAFGFDEARTYWQFVFAFGDPVDPDATRAALREFAADTRRIRRASAVSVTVGRDTATLVAAVEDDRYADVFTVGSDAVPPQITWSYSQRPDGEDTTVTMTHEAGDAVSVPNLLVEGGEFDGLGDRTTIEAGDAVDVAVPTGSRFPPDRIRVVWRSPDRTAILPIATYRLS